MLDPSSNLAMIQKIQIVKLINNGIFLVVLQASSFVSESSFNENNKDCMNCFFNDRSCHRSSILALHEENVLSRNGFWGD